MNKRTPTPTPRGPSARNNWSLDAAYVDARLRAARRARSEALGRILADGWHALGRLTHSLLASKPKTMLRNGS